MKVLALTSLFFLLGLTIHYLFKDDYSQHIWDKYYFLWDKLKDLLLFFGYLFFIPKDKIEIRVTVKAICFFCVIRIVWEFLAISKDYILASDVRVIDVIFTLLLLTISLVWVSSNIKKNGTKRSFNVGFRRNPRV